MILRYGNGCNPYAELHAGVPRGQNTGRNRGDFLLVIWQAALLGTLKEQRLRYATGAKCAVEALSGSYTRFCWTSLSTCERT